MCNKSINVEDAAILMCKRGNNNYLPDLSIIIRTYFYKD